MAYTIQKQVTPDYEYMTSFTQNVKNEQHTHRTEKVWETYYELGKCGHKGDFSACKVSFGRMCSNLT